MSRLAKQAGVAANTVYWYFEDKDDVLLAVLNAVMADVSITGNLFRYELEQAGVDPAAVEAEVMIGIFTIEGLLMHAQDEDSELAICRTLASRW